MVLKNSKTFLNLGVVIMGVLAILLYFVVGIKVPNPKLFEFNLRQECNKDSDCRVSGCCGNLKCGTNRTSGCILNCPAPKNPDLYKNNSCLCVAGKCRWTFNK